MSDDLAVDAGELGGVAGAGFLLLELLPAVFAAADGDLAGELRLSGLQPFSVHELVEV